MRGRASGRAREPDLTGSHAGNRRQLFDMGEDRAVGVELARFD